MVFVSFRFVSYSFSSSHLNPLALLIADDRRIVQVSAGLQLPSLMPEEEGDQRKNKGRTKGDRRETERKTEER